MGPDDDNKKGSSSAVVDCEMSERNGKDPATPEADRLLFGWLKYRPKQLQGFLSPKWALFWLCWAGAIQGMSERVTRGIILLLQLCELKCVLYCVEMRSSR